jgi:Zn ribbon nucleic-acid-binding protein
MKRLVVVVVVLVTSAVNAGAQPAKKDWLRDPNVFPLAVWLQAPSNAAKYKAIGINCYVGLWKGPTDEQLAELKKQGMRVICSQNKAGLAHQDDPTIVAWMHGDEPDNAQSLGKGKGYGPPILPAKIVTDYERIKKADPSRPVLLNLGQGVAWDNYIGRGVRRNHPEDYPEYIKGCDIASFDIYPACHENKEIAGKLWYVPDGVSRLRKWSEDKKQVWNCIECTYISNPKAKATPTQVRAEVWMSLVRGSRGLIYFCHQFKPSFIEAGMLADKEMTAEIAGIDEQIHRLAPVLNSAPVTDAASVESAKKDVPVEMTVRRHDGYLYVFAVCMRGEKTTATFKLAGTKGDVEALGELRKIEAACCEMSSSRGGCIFTRFRQSESHFETQRPPRTRRDSRL